MSFLFNKLIKNKKLKTNKIMKQTAVEFLEEQLNKIKSSSTNMNTWVSFLEKDFKELFTQAKEIENQQRGYSDEEVLNFTQTIIQQYKLGNANIEQLDLLKETLQQFKNKKIPQQEKNEEAQIPDPSDFMKLGEEAFVKNVAENLRAELTPREKILWLQGYLLAVIQYRKKIKKMKTYKVELFDKKTFKSKGIFDTQIPEVLIQNIQESLDKTMIELPRTGVVINEENLTPSFGIMVKDENGFHHLKYRVSISLFNEPIKYFKLFGIKIYKKK